MSNLLYLSTRENVATLSSFPSDICREYSLLYQNTFHEVDTIISPGPLFLLLF